MNDIPHINILNTRVDLVSVDELHSKIKSYISNEEKVTIGNLNIHAANIAYSNPWYANFLDECQIIFCDGKGIQLAAAILGESIPPQITYHTWMWDLLSYSNKSGYSLFLLGSRRDVVNTAIRRINKKLPELRIMGHHGFFNKTNDENTKVVKLINDFNPDIVIVGFGMPAQEKWIDDNKQRLNANVFLNGGAYLEWLSGVQKQAPNWITKSGLEWLFRLYKEPKRLFYRYVIGNPLFIFRIIRQRIRDY